ncbi:MAG: 30S ribosomal protein S20 [Planctomycetes bacterium]|nr:30S ribosomal protein S20 [Planctomycetota bacterium]
MPNTTSAKKRLRQDKIRRLRNRNTKSAMRTQIRKVREATQAGDVEKAEQEFRVAAKRLDQAGAQRVIHPNKASRLKSRLQHMIKKAKQSETVA